MNWSERSWAELAKDIPAAEKAAILPVGATEQHGPHLGCGMDAVLADQLCRAVAARTKVPMLPALAYGCSLGHSRRWPGTLAVQPITLINLVKEIGDWAYHSGVRRLFMVNTHVTNVAPLRCALEMLRAEHDDLMVALFNSATLSARVREFHFADGDDWHANDAETSLMLATSPEMVRPDLIGGADYAVTGDLTLHGVTKSVTFAVEDVSEPSKDPWGNHRIGLSATTKIHRKDFGLTWNSPLETGGVLVGEEVTINLEVQFIKS